MRDPRVEFPEPCYYVCTNNISREVGAVVSYVIVSIIVTLDEAAVRRILRRFYGPVQLISSIFLL